MAPKAAEITGKAPWGRIFDTMACTMHRVRWFTFGVLAACGVAAGAGALLLRQARGFSAREQPPAVERWLANWARRSSMPAEVRALRNPVANAVETLAEARAHWADHCAACHANDGSGDTLLGKNSYPPAPDMRLPETQQKTDGELFYIIENGVRRTGMPAWGGPGHDAQDSWKLVQFIRHLPNLTTEEKIEMEKLNPKSPKELREELEQERFLRGEDTPGEQSHEAHHH